VAMTREWVGRPSGNRSLRKGCRRRLAVSALVLATTLVGWWGLAGVASAASTATNISLTLTPSKIVADGTNASTAKATVTNASTPPAVPVTGDTVGIYVNGRRLAETAHDNLDGT